MPCCLFCCVLSPLRLRLSEVQITVQVAHYLEPLLGLLWFLLPPFFRTVLIPVLPLNGLWGGMWTYVFSVL